LLNNLEWFLLSDAFAEAEGGGGDSSKVHIRVQQRNGRKCITLIEGLADDLDIKRICKVLKYVLETHLNLASIWCRL